MNNQSVSLLSRRPSSNTGAADLNVMPVMNMFIILIPFLISMSAFTHLAAHEFSLPADDQPGQAVERMDLPFTVGIGLEAMVLVQGDIELAKIPNIEGSQDLSALMLLLQAQNPDRVIVAVDDLVSTSSLVSCLDAIRAVGCTNVGLAAGVGVSLSEQVNR